MWHGPHQGAQTSTRTGMVLRAIWRSKIAASTSSGCAAKTLALHFPHFASMAGREGGKRLIVPHLLQTTKFSVICFCSRRSRRCLRMFSMTTGASDIRVSHRAWPVCVFRSQLGQNEAGRVNEVVHLLIQVTASCNMAPNRVEPQLPALNPQFR